MLSLRSVISVLTSFLLLSMSSGYILRASPSISFFAGDLENLRQEAAQKNLPYVIYFSLPEHLECQQLESQTFTYDPLVKYVSSHFLVYHVDAMAGAYAQALIQHYRVKGFPTILVFGSAGQAWGQFFGYMSGQDLYQQIDQLIRTHAEPVLTQGETWRDGTNVAQEGSLQVEGRKPAPMAAQVLVAYDPSDRKAEENFGIKVGRFTNINHLEWEVQKYEHFWHGAIFTYKEVIRGRDYYMLILGGYESAEEADAYANPMQHIAAIDTEIIDLRSLIAGL